MAKRPTLDSIEASLTRWTTKLKRAVTAIDKLEKQKKRLKAKKFDAREDSEAAKALTNAINEVLAEDDRKAKPRLESVNAGQPKPESKSEPADLGIPDFLRRGIAAQKAVDDVIADIKAEQAETKRKKARGRIEKLKAKKSGETKKMPLSGKAAIDFIRNP